ncbi:MAG: hypothetical protein K8H86_00195 [Ignavibacteriaceae bacterium]|nr:hypothetical protein [Ignavibacteriaceae bacterium]
MKLVVFLCIIILLPAVLFPQTERAGSDKHDSIKTILNFESFFNRADYYSNIYSDVDQSILYIDTALLNDENFVALKLTSLNKSIAPEVNTAALPQNILAPLYNSYIENNKFNMVRTILGMTQTAAAGYLAYRHIKKYGFFK